MQNINEKYSKYISCYERIIEMGDLREYMVQEFVVRIFLQDILPKLDVIPTHTKINDMHSVHVYEKYCGIGASDKTVTPDLCIAYQWKWKNDKNSDYRAVVEVKSPCSEFKLSKYIIEEDTTGRRSYNRKIEIEEINDIKNSYIKDELLAHSQKNENKSVCKVIFTDGIAWYFYDDGKFIKKYELGKRRLKRYLIGEEIEYEFIGVEWLKDAEEFNRLEDEIQSFCGEEISGS